jgi:hypothetical protein
VPSRTTLHALPTAAAAIIAQTISHYRVIEKLGGGRIGVVYNAEDTRLHRFAPSAYCLSM